MDKGIAFYSPKVIHFGFDSLLKLTDEAKKIGTKALIITDHVMERVGHVGTCKQILDDEAIPVVVYSEVNSEPNDKYVYDAVALYKREKCDFIISLGGGSCIDTGKAVAILATNEIKVEELTANVQNKRVPHIAIPTTAGTGSEVTDVTVITNSKTEVKMMMKNPLLIPAVAIVDPKLTLSCPPSIIAGTGIDAFCHAVEAFVSRKAHKMTDTLALSAMELIVNNIEAAYHNELDVKAKEAMALASLQAGLAFSNASVCLIHGMSRPLGALFNVPHGVSNAMLLCAVLQFNKKASIDEMAILGEMFKSQGQFENKEELANYAIESIEKLTHNLHIPNLSEWGIEKSEFLLQLDKMAQDAIASGSPANNPIVPTKEEIKNLYLTCFNY